MASVFAALINAHARFGSGTLRMRSSIFDLISGCSSTHALAYWADPRARAHNTPRAQIPKEGMPLVPAQVDVRPGPASGELGLDPSER